MLHHRSALAAFLCLSFFAPALPAQARKTIYVDRMSGLEPFVEKALLDAELPFDFIEEQKSPDLKANLARLHAAQGEILYNFKLGRRETHRLELRDVDSGKVIAYHDFHLLSDDTLRRRAAVAFAQKVRKAWSKQRR